MASTEPFERPPERGLRATGPIAAFQRFADVLGVAAGYLAALCVVMLTLLVLAEIVVAFLARFIAAMPPGIGFAWEYSAYLMGGSFLLGAAMTLRAGLQIRVELLLRAGHGRYARALEIGSAAIGTLVCGFLAATLTIMTMRTYGFGEVSQDSFTPLWYPQALLTLGAGVLAVQMIARLLSACAGHAIDRPEIGAATAIEG